MYTIEEEASVFFVNNIYVLMVVDRMIENKVSSFIGNVINYSNNINNNDVIVNSDNTNLNNLNLNNNNSVKNTMGNMMLNIRNISKDIRRKTLAFANVFIFLLFFFLSLPLFFSNVIFAEEMLKCLRKDLEAARFDTSIIYNLKANNSQCFLLRSLDSPNRVSKDLETSISGTPCSLNTGTDSNLSTYRDTIIKLNTNILNGSTIILNCKTGYNHIDDARKTIACNNGIISYNFSGCKIDTNEEEENKTCRILPAVLTVSNGSVYYYLSTDSSKTPLTNEEIQPGEMIFSNLVCDSGYTPKTTNTDYSYGCQENGNYSQTQNGSLECDILGNLPFHITVKTNITNQSFTFKFGSNSGNNDCTIDWGDGSTDICPSSRGSSINHTYSTAKEYELKVSGKRFVGIDNNSNSASSSLITKLHSYGKWENSITNMGYAFYGSGLNYIDGDAFRYLTEAMYFAFTFARSSSLASIPVGLFANNTEVMDFSNLFDGCSSLTSIPSVLFANNTKVTKFNITFNGCSSLNSIPAGLFANNTKVTSFYSVFYGCSSLTSIPSGLFANNTEVTNFSYAFYNCTSLTSIPPDLFANNTEVTNFSYAFYYSSSLKCTDIDGVNSSTVGNNPNWPKWNASGVNTSGAKTSCEVQ